MVRTGAYQRVPTRIRAAVFCVPTRTNANSCGGALRTNAVLGYFFLRAKREELFFDLFSLRAKREENFLTYFRAKRENFAILVLKTMENQA